ncbi:TPA_asm: UL37.4 [Human alphaherpesvirus 1]|nr:TPA_asm: UL37.4 [Human alphaherpesvirus 1]
MRWRCAENSVTRLLTRAKNRRPSCTNGAGKSRLYAGVVRFALGCPNGTGAILSDVSPRASMEVRGLMAKQLLVTVCQRSIHSTAHWRTRTGPRAAAVRRPAESSAWDVSEPVTARMVSLMTSISRKAWSGASGRATTKRCTSNPGRFSAKSAVSGSPWARWSAHRCSSSGRQHARASAGAMAVPDNRNAAMAARSLAVARNAGSSAPFAVSAVGVGGWRRPARLANRRCIGPSEGGPAGEVVTTGASDGRPRSAMTPGSRGWGTA